MADNITLTGAAIERWFEDLKKRTTIKRTAHDFTRSKRNPWLCYCDGCGLVFSHNRLTQKAIKAGCLRGWVD